MRCTVIFKIGVLIIAYKKLESAWQELSIHTAVSGPILKPNENTTLPFHCHPKIGIDLPKTGIIFISAVRFTSGLRALTLFE